ncbi:MAG: DNA gyrase subunit A [Thermodesulforhabdaceae bacterium]
MPERVVNIEDELKFSYLDYAMSVIVGRAIPDVRDGLKPVHRRILYAMYELGNDYNKPYKKSARIVGDVIGKYHPHGDAAVYDALVRMAQDFSMRYPIVDGQGNFGSVDGDPPAAMRYTEVRMAKITHEFLKDIEKETVPFEPNYDNSLMEPMVLPTRVPNLLLNGASGIAVGMATNIPPHNLRELCQAIRAYIDNPSIPADEIMKIMPAPDFPTGGIIVGLEGIKSAYDSGRGSVRLRGRVTLEELKGKKQALVITEIPFQVNKAKLIERIAELVKEKKIEGIQDIRDESDREGLRIVLVLKADENAKTVENQLYKFTPLEVNFGIIMLAVVNNRPEVLSLKEIFAQFVNFRREVVLRRTEFDLRKAEERAHVLEGLVVALDNLDAVIQIIRSSPTPSSAKERLILSFNLSDKQAQAILDMRLQRLTGLEREKILDEYRSVLKDIERFRHILSSPSLVDQIISEELKEIEESYGDERKTQIVVEEFGQFDWNDLIPEKDVVVVLTRAGYIKRTPLQSYRSQRRGGKGKKGVSIREEDITSLVITASTHDTLLVFTSTGRVYWLNVRDIPEVAPSAQGRSIANLLNIQPNERIATIMAIPSKLEDFKGSEEEATELPPPYVLLATKKGVLKKMSLRLFSRPISSGVRAITLRDGDELIRAKITSGQDCVFLMSDVGKTLFIDESEIRPMGRAAQGVRGMTLDGSDLIGMEIYSSKSSESEDSLLVVSENGFGKRTFCSEFRIQGRGGKGVLNLKVTERTGRATAFCIVKPEDEVLLITNCGRIIRLKASDIRTMGRTTQGVKLMEVNEDEKVVDVTVVSEADKEESDSD